MLLEVVLAVVIFALSVTLVGAVVRTGVSSSVVMAQRARGLALAQSVLAQIRADYLAVTDTKEGDFAPQFPTYHYTVNVTESSDVAALRFITVKVWWEVPPDQHRADNIDSVSLTGWERRDPAAANATGEGGTPGESGPPAP